MKRSEFKNLIKEAFKEQLKEAKNPDVATVNNMIRPLEKIYYKYKSSKKQKT